LHQLSGKTYVQHSEYKLNIETLINNPRTLQYLYLFYNMQQHAI
jgi:hypothetical protein